MRLPHRPESRWASSLPLGLCPSTRRGHCVMSTMKPCHVSAEDMPKVGPLVQKLITTVFANLPGSDEKKCQNEALREAVKKEMEWPHPPGGRLLFTQLRLHRERAKAPEKKPPKRRGPPKKRGPPSPSPPPSAKRSESEPAPAKPAPLADKDPNAGASVVAPTESLIDYNQFRDLLERADKARTGEKVVLVKSSGRPKKVEMRRVGDVEWRKFASQTDAAAAFPGLTAQDVSRLCHKTASPELLAKELEARDVDEGVSLSKVIIEYPRLLRAVRLCLRQADVSSDEGALMVVKRAAWEVNGQPPPESWLDALKSLGKFNESQLCKFAAATAMA